METQKNIFDDVITIKKIFEQLLHRWYIIVAMLVAFVLAALIYTSVTTDPLYNSTAKLYIFNTESENVSTGEITISTYLARDYIEVISDREVLNEVIDNLDLNCSYNTLKSSLTVENIENTRIISVSVLTEDAKLSQQIANEICLVSQEKIVELMGISRVNIVSNAYLPTHPIPSSYGRNVMYSIMIWVILSVCLLVLFVIGDDKIKKEEDVEEYLEVSLLGSIPYSNSKSKTKYSYGKKTSD